MKRKGHVWSQWLIIMVFFPTSFHAVLLVVFTVWKNGLFIIYLRLHGGGDIPIFLKLNEQRCLYDNRQTTCTTKTPIVKPKYLLLHVVSEYSFKTAVRAPAIWTIMRIVCIPETAIQRILNKSLKNYPVSKQPKRSSIGEFQGILHQMAFIYIDAVRHKVLSF